MNDDAVMEVEQALIGSVLKDPAQIAIVKDDLTRSDFQFDMLGLVWEIVTNLHERGMAIDQVTVGDEMHRLGRLDDFGVGGYSGRVAISRLRDEGQRGNAASYAANVKDYSAKRSMVELWSKGAYWSLNGRRAADIQADMIKLVAEVAVPNARADEHTQTMAQAASDMYDHVDRASKGEIIKVPTGFIDIDKMLSGGLTGPDLVIVAARPGQGKTSLVTNMAFNAAKLNYKVAFFTLEMSNKQLALRLTSMISGVPYGRIESGKMQEDEWPLYVHAFEELERLPIFLCDLSAIKPSQIRRTLRTLEAKHGKMDLVIVDYVQLQDADIKTDNRVIEVGSITRSLKAICKEFNVPMLAAAQLSRAVESRASKRPILSDLRESGSIEQDADIVAFIYRPDQYDEKTTKQNIAEIIFAKHRNGPVGSVELLFRSSLTKFENATTRMINLNPEKDYTNV